MSLGAISDWVVLINSVQNETAGEIEFLIKVGLFGYTVKLFWTKVKKLIFLTLNIKDTKQNNTSQRNEIM